MRIARKEEYCQQEGYYGESLLGVEGCKLSKLKK